jgi:hypothetical protein
MGWKVRLDWLRRERIEVMIAIVLVTAVGAGTLILGGSQVSSVLSTVGSSIGGGGPIAGGTGGSANQDTGDGVATGNGDVPPAAGSGPVLDAIRPDLLIIKTGTLDLEVGALGAALDEASSKVAALGGYVSGSEQSGDGDSAGATVTYRVPADRWDECLTALRGLAIRVVDEKTQTDDVTGQVVDLGARITNLQATESALQAIMAKASKISDVLDVQSQLTTVRGEIEQATADRQHLQEQAAFSTLTVHFGLKPPPAVVLSQQQFDPGTEVDRASATLVEILQGLATAGIWFGIVWLPILLALAAIGGALLLVWRRFATRRGLAGPPPAFPPHGTGSPPSPSAAS